MALRNVMTSDSVYQHKKHLTVAIKLLKRWRWTINPKITLLLQLSKHNTFIFTYNKRNHISLII